MRGFFSLDLGEMEENYTDEITHPYPAVLPSTSHHEPHIKSADITYSLNNTPSSARNFFKPEPDKDIDERKYMFGNSSLALSSVKQESMKAAETKSADNISGLQSTVKHEPVTSTAELTYNFTASSFSSRKAKQEAGIKQLYDNSNEDTRDMRVKIESAGESDVTDNNIPKYWSVNTYHESKYIYLHSQMKTEKDDASNGMSYISQQRVGTDNNVAR